MFTKSLSTVISVLLAASAASAAPVRRQNPPNPTDVLVLQFAQVLNQLESQFYQQALAKFQATDITGAGFSSAQLVVEQLTAIQSDESNHITGLQSALQALGQTPVTSCQFDFSSVLTDVTTTVTVARLVENVGVGAFLGAAHLVSDPTILTTAASIVTVEGRHQTMLNIFNNGQAIPTAFDLPLLPNEVLAIAGAFISGCDLGVPANPSLTITNTGGTPAGTQLSFSAAAMNGSMDGMFCQIMAPGMPFSTSMPASQCAIPDSMSGPIAVWITSDDQPLNNDAVDRTNSTTVAGPAMMFVDGGAPAISALIRSANPGSAPSSPSTPDPAAPAVISPAVAGAAAPAPSAPPAQPTTMAGGAIIQMIPAPTPAPAA